jgi:hypothetical protein
MQWCHRIRSAILGVFLDLLWVLGWVQPDRAVRRGWRAAVVYALGVAAVVAAAVGLIPFRLLKAKADVEGWVAAAVIGTIGALLVLLAVAAFVQMIVLVGLGRRATATVVPGDDPSDDSKYQFADVTGRTHVVGEPVARFGTALHPGEQVPLVYLPGRPGTFVLDRFGDKWGVPFLLLGIGLLALIGPLVFVLDLGSLISRRPQLFAPLMFFLVGGIFAVLGIFAVVKELLFRRKAARAVGVVVAVTPGGIAASVERRRREGKTILADMSDESRNLVITVEFEDAAGVKQEGTTEVSALSGRVSFGVGDRVPILYDPDRPWELRHFTHLNWSGPLLVGAVGTVGIAAGLFVAFYR